MYNLFIAFAFGLLLFLLLFLLVNVPLWAALLAALTGVAAVYIIAARLVLKKMNLVLEAAGREIQGQRIEKGIRTLQSALKFGPWQLSTAGQIHSQIGMIYYMKRDFSNAFPHLEKSFPKNWMAMGMLAISYMKKNKKEKMKETFEKAVRWSPKEPLLWSLYAYCLQDCGDNDMAKSVLERGVKKIPGETRIIGNLEAIRDGKKMKMKAFGEMWLQFHLERQSVIMKHQAAALAGGSRRKIIRK
jgi:tetratricopeptide (TPR) repeat protein